MFIAPETLSEKNYVGSRLIAINDETIDAMQVELKSIVDEIEPVTEQLTRDYYNIVDPWYQEAQIKRQELEDIKAKIKEVADKYKTEVEFVESKGQQAQLIKNKMVPIINDLVAPQLGEFEKALQTVQKDGKLYVEVVDEIEEKVKSIRAAKRIK